MAYGGPAGDPQVTADLNTIRVWQRKLNIGTLVWPLEEGVWEIALNKGRGRGPIRHLKTLANRVGWVPHPQGWTPDWKIKHDSSRALLADVTSKPDFSGLETGLSNQALRHLKKNELKICATKKDERTSAALNATLGGVWHEADIVLTPTTEDVGLDTTLTHKNMSGFPYLDSDNRRTPKGRHRDPGLRAMQALSPGQRIRWMKAHLKQADVDSCGVTVDDYQ
eukprot:1808534-Amphidinium_carterae.1